MPKQNQQLVQKQQPLTLTFPPGMLDLKAIGRMTDESATTVEEFIAGLVQAAVSEKNSRSLIDSDGILKAAAEKDGRRVVEFYNLAPTALVMDSDGCCYLYRDMGSVNDLTPSVEEVGGLADAVRAYDLLRHLCMDSSPDADREFMNLVADTLESGEAAALATKRGAR